MKQYRLRKGQERLQVVDGPMAGRSFLPGVLYAAEDIPAADKKKFEQLKHPAAGKKVNKEGGGK